MQLSKQTELKYQLYEKSVQDPEALIDWIDEAFHDLNGRKPQIVREDFCGTFLFSTEWVKRRKTNIAMGLDLDPEPLSYGKKNHFDKLSEDEKKRILIHKQDVITTSSFKSDIVVAGNFSFNTFKEEETLIEYFKNAYQSLNKDGMFILEMAGGPGMIEKLKEKTKFKKNKKPWFTYVWHQKDFDPISHDLHCAIHFHMADGEKMKNAFVYDWRLWTIPELRFALKEAGFEDSIVYWEEKDENGEETNRHIPVKKGDNDNTWITYIAGVRKK